MANTTPTDGTRGGRLSAGEILREARDLKVLRASKYGLTPLVVLTLVDFVQQFDNTVFGLLLPEIRRDLATSITVVLTVGSVTSFVLLSVNWFIGAAVDRWNRVKMVGYSTVGTGVFSLLAGRAGSIATLGIARIGDETSEKVGDLPLFSLLADYYPQTLRGKVFAFRAVARRLGSLLAPIAVGVLAVLYGWRGVYYGTGTLLVVAGVWALVRLREPVRGYWERRVLGADEEVAAEPEPPLGMAEAFRTLMATRTLRRIFAAFAVTGIGSAWFSGLFGFYLAERFGMNALERAVIGVPGDVVALGGALVAGGVVDLLVRRRPQRVLIFVGALSVVSAIGVGLVLLAPSIEALIALNILFAAPTAILAPAVATVFSLVIPPRMRGQGLSIYAYAALPALALQPVAGGIQQAYGLEAGMLAAIPVMIVGAALFASSAAFFQGDLRTATAAAMAAKEASRAREEGRTKRLVIRGLDVHYGPVQVLFDVDLDVEDGEILALLGTNGAGKSTLLRAISGTQEASGGAVLLDGRDITHLPPYEISRLGVVHVPGGRGVFPGMTVRDNLELALWIVPDGERADRLDEALTRFPELRDHLGTEAGLLSGGEQQLVALAQAFLARPTLLVIDELSLGLAPAVVQRLLEVVRQIHAQDTTVILVEQSVNLALTLADRAVFMEKGEIRFDGPTAGLLARPDIMRSVYLKGATGFGGVPAAVSGPGERHERRTVLEVAGVTKAYGGVTAVDGVDLELREGEAVGIIGPNGAGKTTLFDLISGYQPLDAGRVLLDGEDVTDLSADARARRRLVRRFQDARLFPALTVKEAIAVCLERSNDVRSMAMHTVSLPAARRSEQRVETRVQRLLELFELGAVADKFVSELSTGQRRIVDLACVVAMEPKVLLLDEPSTGIAQAEAEHLAPLLRRVRHETGASLLVIEHDIQLIQSVTEELVAMVQGRVVVRGSAEEVLMHPTVVDAYLGGSEAVLSRQEGLPS